MRIRKIFPSFLSIAVIIGTLLTDNAHAQGAIKPNFIIILFDDLGYGDFSCYNGILRTPHVDALAKEGMRFTDFHSNGSVCTPTRAALLTGRYQQRANLETVLAEYLVSYNENSPDFPKGGLKLTEYTFAEALKTAGYSTGIFGKWHLGYLKKYMPVCQGFDEFIGYTGGYLDAYSHTIYNWLDWWNGANQVQEKGYSEHLISNHSIDFIKRHKSGPFCLYVAFHAPHYPLLTPTAADSIKRLPDSLLMGDSARYRIIVEDADSCVGQIMQTIKNEGLSQNTFVFLFSDNGHAWSGSSGPLRGQKVSAFEGGHREPGIAWWPGRIPAGTTTSQLAAGFDLMPTFMELAGASLPPNLKLDGTSLVPLLLHNDTLPSRMLFWGIQGTQIAMRDGPWKCIVDASAPTLLFNLDSDIGEKKNLAGTYPARVTAMTAAINAWHKDVSTDTTPSTTGIYDGSFANKVSGKPFLRIHYSPDRLSARIEYNLKEKEEITLTLIDTKAAKSKLLAAGIQEKGLQSVFIDFNHIPCGLYLMKIQTKSRMYANKIVVLK